MKKVNASFVIMEMPLKPETEKYIAEVEKNFKDVKFSEKSTLDPEILIYNAEN